MKNDGGQAFPRQTFEYFPSLNKTHAGDCSPGMSLHDYFAAAALQNPAICTGTADDWQIIAWFGKERTGVYKKEIVAKQATDYADAMLAERAKSLTSKE